MSQLASLSSEVEGLLDEIEKLAQPAHASKQAIARALGTLDTHARDPQARQAAVRRHDQLTCAERALTQALRSCSQSVLVGREWLALHGARGGGAARQVGSTAVAGAAELPLSAAAGLAERSPAAGSLKAAWEGVPSVRELADSAKATIDHEYGRLTGRVGDSYANQYVFGAVSAFVTGLGSPLIDDSSEALVAAVFSCVLPPPFGVIVGVGVSQVAERLVDFGAETGTKTQSPTESIVHQLVAKLEGHGTWDAHQWAVTGTSAAIPFAVGAVLKSAPLPIRMLAGAAAHEYAFVKRNPIGKRP